MSLLIIILLYYNKNDPIIIENTSPYKLATKINLVMKKLSKP